MELGHCFRGPSELSAYVFRVLLSYGRSLYWIRCDILENI